MQSWLPWAVALAPGAMTLCLALWSVLSDGWDDAPMVEALKDLSLHSVFYAPAIVAAVVGLFMPANEIKQFGAWIGMASVPVALLFFVLGLRCIVRRGQIERLAEQAEERMRLADER